jgi:predicted ribosomally synthesized peptide with nif11-like leader
MERLALEDQDVATLHPGQPGSQTKSLDQLKAFLGKMQNDVTLREVVMAAATADDVAQIAGTLGYEFSGDELLRLSGQKVGRVTVTKQDIPGEYN